MNNRQARNFAIGSTAVAAIVFIALTIDSHRQFPELTQSQNITPQVTRGKDVWHKYNCINCHTLFGEGAYYAPDLTKIAQHRGEPYLRAYLKDPSQFYDENKHRRLMPTQNLADEEITDLIAFLDWVSKVDNQGWPPRPILVTGGMSIPAAADEARSVGDAAPGTQSAANPVALGERLFRTATPACNACHSTLPGANMAGPSLAGVAARAAELIASPDYGGEATDPEAYIRESITHPSAYLVPGAMYSAGGTSFMPATYGDTLSEAQVAQLAAYLASFK